jgi:cardiolipin synthase A/B
MAASWIHITVVLSVLITGCSNSLPNTRAMVHAALERDAAEDRREATRDRGEAHAEVVKGGGPGEALSLPPDTEAAISARLQRFLQIERDITGAPLIGGNQVVLLQNGPAAYSAMFAAMRSARNSINLETFIFTDDEVGQKFASLLTEARRRGVVVNVIYDSFGSKDTSSNFFEGLREAGVSVVEFNPVNPFAVWRLRSLKRRDHRKLLIIDGKIAFTGGINITGDYEKGLSGGPRSQAAPDLWRDTDVEIAGPAVAELQTLFVDQWVKQTGNLMPNADYFPNEDEVGTVTVRVIGSSQDSGFSRMYVTLVAAIWHAERKVYITTAYFAPDDQFIRALKRAGEHGVDIELILPRHSDYAVARYAAQTHYEDLLKAGVKIYERNDAILHAKTVTIDGVWSSVGSTNLDWLSFATDDEVNVSVLDAHFAQQMEQAFAADREQSTEITAQGWAQRSIRVRIRDWLASTVQSWL